MWVLGGGAHGTLEQRERDGARYTANTTPHSTHTHTLLALPVLLYNFIGNYVRLSREPVCDMIMKICTLHAHALASTHALYGTGAPLNIHLCVHTHHHRRCAQVAVLCDNNRMHALSRTQTPHQRTHARACALSLPAVAGVLAHST